MARNWAVCIGINHYVNMPDLRCAKRDAEKMRDWFKAAGFEPIYLFTDDSPPIDDASQLYASQPTFTTLKRFFRIRFKPDTFTVEDNLWFFFSGHGLRHEGKDYLMPSDSDPNPEGIEEMAIPLSYVTERLRGCGAGDVVVIYDACRDEARAKGLGFGEEEQKGVITLASCGPQERSYEIDVPEIYQGSFTYALIEALENTQLGRGNYATFDRLYQQLRYRVPEINRQYGKPEKQHPYGFAQPDEKRYSILLPRQATIQDIETYKKQALNAELNDNLNEAERLLIRLWEICPGDPEIRQYYNRVILKKATQTPLTLKKGAISQTDPSGVKLAEAEPSGKTQPITQKTSQLPKSDLTGEVQLKSEKGIDYTKLRDLLATRKWKEADQETAKVMYQAAGRGWLRVEDIDNFPCEDLRTINQLWLHYSDGKFGFSVQKKIYESLGGTREDNEKVWLKFCDRVGWRKGEMYGMYSDLIWNLELAPQAHLPSVCCWGGWSVGWNLGMGGALLSRKDLQPVRRREEEEKQKVVSLPKKPPPSNEVELKSERGVDYTKLRDLLAAGKWKEADQETGKVMCQAAGRESEGWLRAENIDNFPCEDLRTINQLWLHYSNGKFSFSVQKEIHESLGGTRKYNKEVWVKFCDRVGRRKGGNWLNYSDLTFNLELASPGSLPIGCFSGVWDDYGNDEWRLLFSRAKTFNL